MTGWGEGVMEGVTGKGQRKLDLDGPWGEHLVLHFKEEKADGPEGGAPAPGQGAGVCCVGRACTGRARCRCLALTLGSPHGACVTPSTAELFYI